jgi:hypothetical protein
MCVCARVQALAIYVCIYAYNFGLHIILCCESATIMEKCKKLRSNRI